MKSQSILRGTSSTERRALMQNAAPVAVLILLSPILAELLTGIIGLSKLWLLIPEMAVYGSAAVIIRELVRRNGRGWGSMLLLGIAYAIAEECIILQTSLTPQFFPPGAFGWAGSANWIYLVALVWYEAVYAIVLPIYLTEMLFRAQRNSLWLSKRGLAIAGGIFLVSSAGVYELWHRVGLARYGNSTYHVPLGDVGMALLVIAVIVGVAMLPRSGARAVGESKRRAPAAWLVGVLAFGFGLAWFVLIVLAYVPAASMQGASPAVPIAVGLVWLAGGLALLRFLASGAGWSDVQRLALIFGMSLAGMVGGIAVVAAAGPIDIAGKIAFDLAAIVLFIRLVARVRSRGAEPASP